MNALKLADGLEKIYGLKVEALELRRLHELTEAMSAVGIRQESEVMRLQKMNAELLEFVQEVRRTGDTRLASMAIAAIAKTGEQQ